MRFVVDRNVVMRPIPVFGIKTEGIWNAILCPFYVVPDVSKGIIFVTRVM